MKKMFKKFIKESSGTVMIIFALTLVILIGFVGGVMDFGRAYMVSAKMGDSINAGRDAAVKMGSSTTDAQQKSEIRKYFAANYPSEGYAGVTIDPNSLIIGKVPDPKNPSLYLLTVEANGLLSTPFLKASTKQSQLDIKKNLDISYPSCVPAINTREIACSNCASLTKQQTSEVKCPSGTVTPWVDVDNPSCVTRETQEINCLNGNGTKQQYRDLNCSTGVWGPWYDVDPNSCPNTCKTTTQTQTVPCTSGNGTKTQTRNFLCPSKTWSNWVDADVSACNCTPPKGQPTRCTIACPQAKPNCPDTVFYGGRVYQKRVYDCSTGTFGAWEKYKSDCTWQCRPPCDPNPENCPTPIHYY